jgi:transposase
MLPMRGSDSRQTTLFHFVEVEDRIPAAHPLRAVRTCACDILLTLSPRFNRLYARSGRAAIPVEQLLRAMLLWALYGVPSERRLLEELDYNLLFRWFVGLGMEDEIWPRTTFWMNRRRMIESGLTGEFFARVLAQIRGRVVSNDHFNMNWPLIEEWSGQMRMDDEVESESMSSAPKGRDTIAQAEGLGTDGSSIEA